MTESEHSRVAVRYLGDEPIVLVLASGEFLAFEPTGAAATVASEDLDLLLERGDFEIEGAPSD